MSAYNINKELHLSTKKIVSKVETGVMMQIWLFHPIITILAQ